MFWIFQYLLYAIGSSLMLTVSLTSYLAFLQPDFYFPSPTGSYAVGTTTRHIVDNNKELMIQMWYPTAGAKTDKPTAPYASYVVDYYRTNHTLIWLLTMSRPMYTYAQQDVPAVENEHHLPVIIFSHGLGESRNQNTVHCEELASNGYVVVSISHSFGCSIVQFPDGRVVVPNQNDILKRLIENPMADFEAMNQNINIWIDDIKITLDYLEEMTINKKSLFYNCLDMENVGIFGHSYGGATAAQLCRQDNRIKAGVSMDGPLFGHNATMGFNKPFMFLLASESANFDMQTPLEQMGVDPDNAQKYAFENQQAYLPAIRKLAKELGHHAHVITIKDTAHAAFTDMAILKEACQLSGTLQNLGAGKLDGFRITHITNELLVSFFDTYLKGQSSILLDGDISMYPEIEKNF